MGTVMFHVEATGITAVSTPQARMPRI